MSTSFTFSLDAALKQRTRDEQMARLALAQTISAYAGAAESAEVLKRARKQAMSDDEAGAGAGDEVFNTDTRICALLFLDRGAESIRRQHGVVEHWENEVRQRRAMLVEASQRRRSIERLRERRKREYDAALQRRLDGQIDELVTTRYRRAELPPEDLPCT